jgi:hypothetical protein
LYAASAGKPTPQPYPQPGAEFSGDAYPPPVPVIPAVTPTPGPAPTPEGFGPTDPDPRLYYPYSWGYLNHVWPVTLDGVGLSPDLTGSLCLRNLTTFAIRCFDLQWVHWYGDIDRNVFQATNVPCLTGGWAVFSVFVLRFGDIREPNIYSLSCILHFPSWIEG